MANRCPHIYNIQKTTYKLAVRVIGKKQIHASLIRGEEALGRPGGQRARLLQCKCSVNSQMPDTEGSIYYDLFTSAVAMLKESCRGSLLAKLDLRDPYRHIPVCSMDWNLLGVNWMGKFYYPVILMFRGKSASYIFNLFSEALHWIIQNTSQQGCSITSMIFCPY